MSVVCFKIQVVGDQSPQFSPLLAGQTHGFETAGFIILRIASNSRWTLLSFASIDMTRCSSAKTMFSSLILCRTSDPSSGLEPTCSLIATVSLVSSCRQSLRLPLVHFVKRDMQTVIAVSPWNKINKPPISCRDSRALLVSVSASAALEDTECSRIRQI